MKLLLIDDAGETIASYSIGNADNDSILLDECEEFYHTGDPNFLWTFEELARDIAIGGRR